MHVSFLEVWTVYAFLSILLLRVSTFNSQRILFHDMFRANQTLTAGILKHKSGWSRLREQGGSASAFKVQHGPIQHAPRACVCPRASICLETFAHIETVGCDA